MHFTIYNLGCNIASPGVYKKILLNKNPFGQMKISYNLFFISDLKYESCWLDTSSGMMWAFIAPALLVITLNLIILIKVLVVSEKIISLNF